jgi:hypothetical protein
MITIYPTSAKVTTYVNFDAMLVFLILAYLPDTS